MANDIAASESLIEAHHSVEPLRLYSKHLVVLENPISNSPVAAVIMTHNDATNRGILSRARLNTLMLVPRTEFNEANGKTPSDARATVEELRHIEAGSLRCKLQELIPQVDTRNLQLHNAEVKDFLRKLGLPEDIKPVLIFNGDATDATHRVTEAENFYVGNSTHYEMSPAHRYAVTLGVMERAGWIDPRICVALQNIMQTPQKLPESYRGL